MTLTFYHNHRFRNGVFEYATDKGMLQIYSDGTIRLVCNSWYLEEEI